MESLIKKYKGLKLNEILDFNKFNLISICHNSTKIEGSTLTELESQILLDNGLTPKGRPINDILMVRDHFKALKNVLNEANSKTPISIDLIKNINANVMSSTGGIFQTIFGEIDVSKGMFRKGNVTTGTSYFPNFDKVEKLTIELVKFLNQKMKEKLSNNEILELSFDAHLRLVSIHPFYDGNGRTSRLLMNYIQAFYNLPLATVYSKNKKEYIQALINVREKDDITIFRKFMKNEYKKHLNIEIKKYTEG